VQRGEVWWLERDSAAAAAGGGFEPPARRPVVIVSNNAANRNLNRVVVVPLSANGERQYPGEARVTVSDQCFKVSTDQIAAVPKTTLSSLMAELTKADMQAVDDALQLHLALPR
jgi:mRNA interferase MazF